MQRCFLKILIILIGSVFLFELPALGQISPYRLQQADSLFQAKRYTQSMEHYRFIFNEKQYTPAMLLKMAYIEEGLNQTGQALYYLNLYYNVTDDQTVLEKMEELATKYNLEGYEQTDTVRALSFYHDYYKSITLGLVGVVIVLLSVALFLKWRKHNPLAPVIILQLMLVLLLVHVNFGERTSVGIISSSNTYIMNGPSSGASVVTIVEAGHRVQIVGRKDVWIKILWQGETVYIKENNLLPLTL
jgi:uncharacterized protein YxeA